MTGSKLFSCGELRVANELLGDAGALARAWDRDGYWFFDDAGGVHDPGRSRPRARLAPGSRPLRSR
ncbi:MAG: hypothetical protein AB7Q97_00195 [Gammaproteobacteria bacterium]